MKKIILILILVVVIVSAIAAFWFASKTPPKAEEVLTGLVVNSVKPGDEIKSPLEIKGYVNGEGWGGFEAQVGVVRLLDSNGFELALGILNATTEWMTTKIDFATTLEFESVLDQEGVLLFTNENPSGLPENDRQYYLPVRISKTVTETMKVKAYYSNSVKDPEVSCTNVYSVEREVPKTEGVARAALEELLKGLTNQEKTEGFSTGINPGVKIQSLTIENGVAKVDFNGILEYEVGGSCRVAAIRSQIAETLKQFTTVTDVIISIDGRTEDILQP